MSQEASKSRPWPWFAGIVGFLLASGMLLGVLISWQFLGIAIVAVGLGVGQESLAKRYPSLLGGLSAKNITFPIKVIDEAFRGSLDEAYQIAEEIKDNSEVGVLQVSESVARIYTDLGNHIRDIDSLHSRMNDEEVENSLASVVSRQRNFMETVPEVLQSIQEQTQELSKTAVEAQAHTIDILTLVGDISKITKSSKLLAVNALVEAARAGDRGKGFAVVATTMREVAEQVATFSDSIAQISESISNLLPQMATVSDEISRTCADQASRMATRVSSLSDVYDTTRVDLVDLLSVLKNGGDHVRTNANQILMELQFQDRMRQELERMQARTRVPMQVLFALSHEIEKGEVDQDDCFDVLSTLALAAREDLKQDTTHSENSGWKDVSGDVEMF